MPLGACKTDAYKRPVVVLTKNTAFPLFPQINVSSRMHSLAKHIAASVNAKEET